MVVTPCINRSSSNALELDGFTFANSKFLWVVTWVQPVRHVFHGSNLEEGAQFRAQNVERQLRTPSSSMCTSLRILATVRWRQTRCDHPLCDQYIHIDFVEVDLYQSHGDWKRSPTTRSKWTVVSKLIHRLRGAGILGSYFGGNGIELMVTYLCYATPKGKD